MARQMGHTHCGHPAKRLPGEMHRVSSSSTFIIGPSSRRGLSRGHHRHPVTGCFVDDDFGSREGPITNGAEETWCHSLDLWERLGGQGKVGKRKGVKRVSRHPWGLGSSLSIVAQPNRGSFSASEPGRCWRLKLEAAIEGPFAHPSTSARSILVADEEYHCCL